MFPRVNELPPWFILAVSGGVDSMTLLDWLVRHDRKPSLVVHVHHGLRHDADDDAALVDRTCAAAGIPCRILSVKVRKTNSVQQQARSARYGAIGRLCFQMGISTVVTAHQLNDVSEAHHAAQEDQRRSSAMPQQRIMSRWGIKIFRPLLQTSRDEILAYANTHAVQWREDPSNQDLRYRRAQIRATNPEIMSQAPSHGHEDAFRWFGVDLAEFIGPSLDVLPGAVSRAFPGCDISNAALELIKTAFSKTQPRQIDSHGVRIWVEGTVLIQRTLGASQSIDHSGDLRWAGLSESASRWLNGPAARSHGGQRLRDTFRSHKTPVWYRRLGPVGWPNESSKSTPHLLKLTEACGLRLEDADALEF